VHFGPHISPTIFADLNIDDKNDWRIDAYKKRGGYQALKKILEEKVPQEAVIAAEAQASRLA
jgi:NADH-quinone oxidoreductase subunit F